MCMLCANQSAYVSKSGTGRKLPSFRTLSSAFIYNVEHIISSLISSYICIPALMYWFKIPSFISMLFFFKRFVESTHLRCSRACSRCCFWRACFALSLTALIFPTKRYQINIVGTHKPKVELK